MTIGKIKRLSLWAGFVAVSMSLAGQPAFVDGRHGMKIRHVDCDNPKASIQKVVDKIKHGRPTTIFIEGTCTENVTITKDDVTLRGGSGTVIGQITIDGAQRVVIDGLRVTGPGDGVLVMRQAAATLRYSTFEGNDESGIEVAQEAFALIEHNTIRDNGDGSCEIFVRDSSNTRLVGNIVVSTQVNCGAIDVFRHGSMHMAGGNHVTSTNEGGVGVEVFMGSTFRQSGEERDFIQGGFSAVVLGRQSNADIRDAGLNVELPGLFAVRVDTSSYAQVRDSTLNGDISITDMSSLFLTRDVDVAGLVKLERNSNFRSVSFTGLKTLNLTGNVEIVSASQAFFEQGVFVSGDVFVDTTTQAVFDPETIIKGVVQCVGSPPGLAVGMPTFEGPSSGFDACLPASSGL